MTGFGHFWIRKFDFVAIQDIEADSSLTNEFGPALLARQKTLSSTLLVSLAVSRWSSAVVSV